MQIHRLPPTEVFAALGTGPRGLSAAQVGERRENFGPNELERPAGVPRLWRLLRQFTHFLALLLWAAALLCFVLQSLNPEAGMAPLGFAILGVIGINALFAFFQEYRAEKAMEALARLLPLRVRVVREGQEQEMAAADLVPGDVIHLSEGDQVPADARLVECVRMQVNQAALTGESDPSSRRVEASEAAQLLDSRNLVWAGTTVVSGSALGVVFATGRATEFGKVAHLTATIRTDISPLQKEITLACRIIAGIAIGLGLVFFGLNFWLGRSVWGSLLFAIGILVAGVPEGLLPTVSLALAMGSQRLARRQALVRSLNKVETLGCATVICTDKTGTLTQNRMTVVRVYADGTDRAAAEPPPDSAGAGVWEALALIAVRCNNARLDPANHADEGVGDPTEVALLRWGRSLPGPPGELPLRVGEIPFAAERQRMSTLDRGADGRVTLFCKGAPEVILARCSRVLTGAEIRDLDQGERERLTEAVAGYATQALRVLALAHRPLETREEGEEDPEQLERDLILTGVVGLMDPPRPEVPEAVRRCRQAGIRLIIVTGDQAATARAVGRQVGLGSQGEPPVWEGAELDRLAPARRREVLAAPEVILARMTPRHKMQVVMTLKEMQEVVAVTGDGVNDAPALKAADIGIAMGRSGTEVARSAADLILLDDNFATIINAIEEGRAIYANLKKFITYIFASNIPEIVPFLCFVLWGIPLPLTILQILAIDLGTDMFPALALAAEPPEPGTMQRPPRSPREHLLTWPLLARAYLFLGPLEALGAMSAYFLVYWQSGWRPGMEMAGTGLIYLKATTMCLAGIIMAQVGNLFACRTETTPALGRGLGRNRLLRLALGLNAPVILAFFYLPFFQGVLGLAPLSWRDWLWLLPLPVVLLGAEEMRKAWGRRRRAPGAVS